MTNRYSTSVRRTADRVLMWMKVQPGNPPGGHEPSRTRPANLPVPHTLGSTADRRIRDTTQKRVSSLADSTHCGSGEVIPERVGGSIGFILRVDLAINVVDMPLDSADAEAEVQRNLFVTVPPCDQNQHFDFARRQLLR